MKTCGNKSLTNLFYFLNVIFAVLGVGIKISGTLVLANISDFYFFLDARIIVLFITLIASGVFAVFVAFIGCVGAFKESYRTLIVFVVLLSSVIVLELGAGIAIGHVIDDITVAGEDNLRRSMIDYPSSKVAQEAWDNLQRQLQCCGMYDKGDWQSIPLSTSYQQTRFYPDSCFTCQGAMETTCLNDGSSSGSSGALFPDGCLFKITMRVRRGALAVVGLVIVVALIELVSVFVAFILLSTIIIRIRRHQVIRAGDEVKVLKDVQ